MSDMIKKGQKVTEYIDFKLGQDALSEVFQVLQAVPDTLIVVAIAARKTELFAAVVASSSQLGSFRVNVPEQGSAAVVIFPPLPNSWKMIQGISAPSPRIGDTLMKIFGYFVIKTDGSAGLAISNCAPGAGITWSANADLIDELGEAMEEAGVLTRVPK